MKKILVFTMFLVSGFAVLYAGGSQEVVPQASADGFMTVTSDEMDIRWKVAGDKVDFEITADTTGWVAIGFNPSRVMKDADYVFGFVKDGKATVSDHFGDGTFSHADDESLGGENNILDYSGSESGGKTTLKFTIPIDSGDEYDSVLTPGETHTVLFAHGPDGADNFEKKHSFRGKAEVQF